MAEIVEYNTKALLVLLCGSSKLYLMTDNRDLEKQCLKQNKGPPFRQFRVALVASQCHQICLSALPSSMNASHLQVHLRAQDGCQHSYEEEEGHGEEQKVCQPPLK